MSKASRNATSPVDFGDRALSWFEEGDSLADVTVDVEYEDAPAPRGHTFLLGSTTLVTVLLSGLLTWLLA